MSSLLLSSLFAKHGSDKTTDHSYGEFYDRLQSHRAGMRSILELGVYRGASLLALAEAFPLANVHGIDVDLSRMPEIGEPRITTHKIDVLDQHAMRQLALQHGPFDLVIDDGAHTLLTMLAGYFLLSRYMATGGIYVIEDVPSDDHLQYLMAIPGATKHDYRRPGRPTDDLLVSIEARS